MTVKLFGITDDGTHHLRAMAPGPAKLLQFSAAINEELKEYPKAMVTDDTEMQNGLLIWTVYDHPRDWPDWYVARLFVNDRMRGNMLLNRDLQQLRDELAMRGLTPLNRSPTDDPVILETWL